MKNAVPWICSVLRERKKKNIKEKKRGTKGVGREREGWSHLNHAHDRKGFTATCNKEGKREGRTHEKGG